jgi:hypothetical protein
VLEASGDDARSFLHAQLTSDIDGLPMIARRHGGWCSAKGGCSRASSSCRTPKGYLLAACERPRTWSRETAGYVRPARESEDQRRERRRGCNSESGDLELKASLASVGIEAPGEDLRLSGAGTCSSCALSAQHYLLIAPQEERARLATLGDSGDATAGRWKKSEPAGRSSRRRRRTSSSRRC